VGFTEPSAWISEATHQTVFTEWIFPILQLQSQGCSEAAVWRLSFSSLSAFSKRGGSVAVVPMISRISCLWKEGSGKADDFHLT
jgi:hypothetical protein